LEQGGHGQGGGGHGQGRVAGGRVEQAAQKEHPGGVDRGQQGGEQPVGQGAVDQPIDVVEPVAQDGHADAQVQGAERQSLEDHVPQPRRVQADQVGDQDRGQERAPVGQPLELLALLALGPPEPGQQRDGRGQHGQESASAHHSHP
jgi:hypothetical protein